MAETIPLIIGIAGGTGSGKTTIATQLAASVPVGRARIVAHDWYYRDRSALSPVERAELNFDHPDALQNDLLLAHLLDLKDGRGVDCPQYDFATHTRRKEHVRIEPCPIVLVEGILLFALPELRAIFDLRLFIDTPDDIRLLRRIKRDLVERGRDIQSVATQYLGSVREMHELHVAPTRKYAHLIVPEGGENAPAIEAIQGRLLQHLAS